MSSAAASSRILRLVLLVALERLERRAEDDRDVVAREVVLVEQVADLDLDELEQLVVVDHVDLVEEHHDVGHADLAGEQDVLARLGHRAVGRRDHQDRAVHLRGAGDHVLDVVGVAGAVDVGVVAVLRLVLDVRGGDRDAALLLLRRVVDLLEALGLAALRLGQDVCDRRGQRGLAMVDMTDGADVAVRLVALELLLRHWGCSFQKLVEAGLSRWAKANLRNILCYCARLRPARRCGLDDLLGDVAGDLLVAVELHRVVGPALRVGTQVGRVAEHRRQRHARLDRDRVSARLLGLDPAAAAREVADHGAEEVVRGHDLDGHDRLEQHGLGALARPP